MSRLSELNVFICLNYVDVLGVSAACRESFRVFTLGTCFTTQPAGRGRATYCQGKARYSWIIFRQISPYKLLRRPVSPKLILTLYSKSAQFCRFPKIFSDPTVGEEARSLYDEAQTMLASITAESSLEARSDAKIDCGISQPLICDAIFRRAPSSPSSPPTPRATTSSSTPTRTRTHPGMEGGHAYVMFG